MSEVIVERTVMVEAELNYLVPTGERPVTYAYDVAPGAPRRTGQYRLHRVPVSNARLCPPPGGPVLDRNGFEIHRHASVLRDFSDDAAIRSIYYDESARLLRTWTGAQHVVIFDHTLRDGNEAREAGIREPVRYIHNDQTFVSGPRRVRDHLPPDEAEARLKRRFAIINLWRPLATVESAPLALCDARSIDLGDLVTSDLVYREFTGETYALAYSPRHRWYFFPRMTPDEALLIKIYDSAGDGIARLSAHTAFDDPSSLDDAPPRRSIELRALVFF